MFNKISQITFFTDNLSNIKCSSLQKVLRKMSLFDEGSNGTLTHLWLSKEGNLESVVHYPAATYGIDAHSTLEV